MEKKYPVLKCNKELWEKIKLVLESFGINKFADESFDNIHINYIVSNYGSEDLDKLNIGIVCVPIYNDAETLRYLVNTKEEFLSAVAKLLDKEYPITSKNNKDMEKINIAEKLKYCKKGTKLYSPIFGEVEFENVDDKIEVIVHTDKEDICKTFFEKDGKYYMFYKNAECLLFPSKDNRDWNTFQVLEEGHRVMVSDNGGDWYLRNYYINNIAYRINNKNHNDKWKYIVPIEYFDFTAEDITINKEKSII